MPNLPSDVLDAALNAHQRQQDERLAASLEQQAAPVRQALFNAQLPDLNDLLQGLNPTQPAAQSQAAPAPQQPAPAFNFQMPSLNDLLGELAPKPQSVQPRIPQSELSPNGTPITAPRTVDATITAGPKPDQQLRPGESVGSVTLGDGTSAQQPAPSGGNYGEIDNSSRQSFVRTAYPYMLDAAGGDRNLAELMLAKAISENGDVGKGGGFIGNNFCYDEATEVLTIGGWVRWPHVKKSDLFATFNADSGAIEYQRASHLTRAYYGGQMFRVASDSVDLLVTPEHRMWVRPSRGAPFQIIRARDLSDRAVEYLTLHEVPTIGGVPRIRREPVPAFGNHVRKVSRLRALKEMVGAYTRWVVAAVADFLRRYQRDAVGILKSPAVSEHIAPVVGATKSSVPLRINVGRPDPARSEFRTDDWSVLVNLRPEASNGVAPTGARAETVLALLDEVGVGQKVFTAPVTGARNGASDTLVGHRPSPVGGVTPRPSSPRCGAFRRKNYTASGAWETFSGMVYCATVPNGLLVVRRNGKAVVSGNSGIKGVGSAGSFEADTWEDYGNGRVNIRDKFAAYRTPQEGFQAFMGFLRENKRYAPALQRYEQTRDADQLFRDIHAAGYATDPIWTDKVQNIRANQVAPYVPRPQTADARQSLNAGSGSVPSESAPAAAGGPPPPTSGSPDTMWSPDGPVEQQGAFQAATGRSGGAGVMYRGPLSAAPAEVGNDEYIDPDQGPREAIPGSVGASPVQPYGPPLSEAGPEQPDYSYTLADGRTEPPTPQGDWIPTQTIPNPRTASIPPPDQTAQGTPIQYQPASYGPALSEAGPEPVNPYDAEQPWRPTLQLGSPPAGPSTPPAAPNAELDAPVPYGPLLSEAGPEGPPAEPTTWYGRAGKAVLDNVIAPALQAYDTANEWLINNPVTGTFNPQAMGRELAGADQISREVREDQQRLEALIRRFRAGDTSVEAEIQALTANLNARTGGGRAGLLAAGERNPDKGAETAGQVAQAALTLGIAPSAASGAARNVVGAAMDPLGQGIGLAADAIGPAVRGARTVAGRALNAGADAPLPSSVGSGFRTIDGTDPLLGMRTRVVPPDVADTLDFPIRVPEDPATIRAIEAAGGRVDPERGVDLYVTRAQGPDAAGGVATRGGVFYEAIPEGGRSAYARGSDDPNNVGGSTVIPRTPTRFRSPLILSDAPGARQGFDDAMEQMGASVPNPPSRIEGYATRLQDAERQLADVKARGEAGAAYLPAAEDYVRQARADLEAARTGTMKFTSADVDRAINEARRAGPEGSPARAAALKEVVRRYGGTPDEIDALLAIRGADASESTWAIKENILAAHARRNGYDGVVTVQQSMDPKAYGDAVEAAVQAHPQWKAQKAVVDSLEAKRAQMNARYDSVKNTHGQDSPQMDALYDEWNAIHDEADDAVRKLEIIHDRLLDEVDVPIPSKITELVDVREARNPTPPSDPNPAKRAAQQEYEQLWTVHYEAAQKAAANRNDILASVAAKEAKAAMDRAYRRLSRMPSAIGEPGYTLRDDLPRRPQAVPGGSGFVPRLSDAQNAAQGALVGAYGEQMEEAATGEDLNLTPQERLARMAGGAALGVAAGRRMRPGAAANRLGSGVVPSAAAARNEAMVNVWSRGPRKAPDSSIPWRTRLTAALSDDLAPFAHMEREAEQRIGRALSDDEKISVLARINPDGAAQQRLQQNIAPAVRELQAAGGNVNDLNLGLMLTHNIDVANEMERRTFEAAIAAGKSPSKASALAQAAANDRKFFGGTGRDEMVEQLEALQARIVSEGGEDAVRAYDAAADRIWQHQRETLERMVERGVVSRAQADELLERYPHYIKTYVLDFDNPAASIPNAGGKGVSLRESPVKALSVKGSDRETLSPLESIVKRTIEAERAAHKNAIYNAFLSLIDEDDTLRRSVTESRVTGTKQITGFVDGERQTMRIARPLADVLERPGQGPHIPILSDILNWWKGAITSRNPGFGLVVSPMRDAADFAVRQSTVEGGPQMIGRVTQAYAEQMKQAFGDIVSGRALRGEMTGDAQRFMEAGGFSGRLNTTEKGIHQIAREITRGGGAPIDSQAAKDIIKDSLTFGWAEKLGNRLEQVPRAAAMRLAERRGAKPTTAMMAGRDATIDFQRGGWLIRYANTIIPFLNPTVQSTAQLARLVRDHPKAAVATIGALVGGPAMAAEAYNRADEQRARAYSDVPDYIKDTGVVIMMPWAGSDERGDRPNYIWYPLGVFAPFAMMAREAVARPLAAAGQGPESQRTAGELLTSMLTAYSPIKGESAGSVLSSVVPPGVSTGIELSQNKDFFRNRTISSDRADENASSLAHGISGVLNTVGRAGRGFPGMGGLEDATPSQVDYAIRSDTGIYGQTARAASDLVTGKTRKENRPIQNAPVVGGIAGRIIRDQGGARMDRLREPDAMAPGGIEDALDEAGVKRSEVTGVSSSYKGAPLTREEQENWQEITNSLIERKVAEARRSSEWRARGADKEKILRNAVNQAKEEAASRALRRLTDSEIERRKKRAS